MSALHPFDFAALSKGTWIETDELELAAVCRRDDLGFALAVLRLKSMIEERTGILARVDGQRLRLMTDGEAFVWTTTQAGKASRALDRNAHRLAHNITRGNLTAGEQVRHEHALRVVTLMADAQRAERDRNAKLFSLATCRKLKSGT